MSRSREIIRSRSETAVRRKPRNSTKNKPRTISIAGAACGLRIPRKLTSIGLKPIRWAAGTAPVGIGIRITAVTPTFREMESSTARSAGVSIRPSACTILRLAFTAITTIISVPTGIAGVAVTITLLTTITVSIMALVATTDIVASLVETTMVAEGSMGEKAFMAAKAPTVVEAFTVAEAVTVAAGAAIAKT